DGRKDVGRRAGSLFNARFQDGWLLGPDDRNDGPLAAGQGCARGTGRTDEASGGPARTVRAGAPGRAAGGLPYPPLEVQLRGRWTRRAWDRPAADRRR